MAGTMLKIDIRRGKILEKLKREGTVSVSKLAAELGATPVTIRNDLDALEKDGYLVRIQGGAVTKPKSPVDTMENSGLKVGCLEEKLRIAEEVAGRIRDGSTLFMNSGTTMQIVGQALRNHRNLNVVTNSLTLAMELGKLPSFRVILLGGEVNAQYGFTYGSDAQEALSHYQADWALLSLDGVGKDGGMTTLHAEEHAINRMMIAQAKQVLVAADNTKIGRTGFFRFETLQPGMQLVTDRKADRETVVDLRSTGVQVTLVED